MSKRNKHCIACGAKLAKQNKSGYCRKCYTHTPWNKGTKGAQENNGMRGKKHKPESIQKMVANQWNRSGKRNPMYGKTHKLEAKKKISEARTNNPSILKHNDETKRKMRKSAIAYLKETYGDGWAPRYNKLACRFFDYINGELKLQGQHAENGGEYFVEELGYWLDFFDVTNKIIIENNERKHYQPTRLEKTLTKERELRNYFPDYDIIITNIPRTKQYEEERVALIFEEEKRRISTRRESLFRRRN